MSRQFSSKQTINEKSTLVHDLTNKELFQDILLELKKMNVHLSMITNDEVKEEDI
jgi:hypothetical protein